MTRPEFSGSVSPAELGRIVAGMEVGQPDAEMLQRSKIILEGMVRLYRARGFSKTETRLFMGQYQDALVSQRMALLEVV